MKTLIGWTIGAAAAASITGAASAQIFLGTFGGSTYYIDDTVRGYNAARTFAQNYNPGNSYLFSIETAAEEAAVTNLMRAFYGDQGPVFWIGLTNELNPGNPAGWTGLGNTWASGAPITYTNWAGGVDFSSTTEIYASYNWAPVPVWIPLQENGGPNFGFKRSIIEVIPSPSAAAVLGLGGLLIARRRR